MRNGHPKDHQTADGKIFASGEYESETDLPEDYADGAEFVEEVKMLYLGFLTKIHSQSDQNPSQRRVKATENQREVLERKSYNYRSLWNRPKPLSSHSTCFACLFYSPQTVLPCGHVLCRKCVEDFACSTGAFSWTFQQCPLCAGTNTMGPWSIEVRREPPQAAPRVLSLDGSVHFPSPPLSETDYQWI